MKDVFQYKEKESFLYISKVCRSGKDRQWRPSDENGLFCVLEAKIVGALRIVEATHTVTI